MPPLQSSKICQALPEVCDPKRMALASDVQDFPETRREG